MTCEKDVQPPCQFPGIVNHLDNMVEGLVYTAGSRFGICGRFGRWEIRRKYVFDLSRRDLSSGVRGEPISKCFRIIFGTVKVIQVARWISRNTNDDGVIVLCDGLRTVHDGFQRSAQIRGRERQ